jgi:hypothetical protein
MKIDGKEYPFALNINTLRKTAKILGKEDVTFLDKIMSEMGKNVKISHLETIAHLIMCGVDEGNRLARKANGQEVLFELDLDDTVLALTENPEELSNALNGLASDLPVSKKK